MVPEKMMGWERQGTVETYDRETIFDYIDGAGEVYLAYGFSKVDVYRFTRADNPDITVEVFHMGSAHDAYGVFSHSRMEEQTGIGDGYEYRGSVLCFWAGSHLVCVMADKQIDQSKEAVFALARAVADNIKETGEKPDMVEYLPQENLDPGSVRYFHNYASMNYHYFLAEENVLGLSQETEAVLGVYEPGDTYLVCVRYPFEEAASAAYDRFQSVALPGAYSQTAGDYLLMVFDAADEAAARDLMCRCVDHILEK